MNRFVLTVACLLLLPTAVLSACGSCGDGAAEPAPLAEAPERADFSSLPEAANPFTKTPAGKDVAISALALPAKAPILLRLRSPNRLDAILQAYTDARSSVGGGALEWGTATLLGQVLAFDPAEWMARDKPATLFLVDPTKYVLGEVLVLGIHDTDALLRVLPKGGFDPDEVPPEGHTAVYRTKTGILYVDFIGSEVVFTKHNDVFGIVKGFIAKDLAAWGATSHDTEIIIDVPNMREAFAKEIALTREDPTPGGKRGSGVPLLSKPALLALVDGFERIHARIDLEQGHFKVRTVTQQTDTPTEITQWLADISQALSAKTAVQIAGLPTGAWAAASVSADLTGEPFAPKREAISAEINTLYGELLDLTPAEREASAPLWSRFVELLRGSAYAFAFEQGEVPACGALVVDIVDAHRARFLTKRLLETFFLRIIPRLQDEEITIGDMPIPDGDFRTLDELIVKLNEVYGQVGMAFYQNVHSDSGDDVAVETLGIRFDAAKREEAAKAGERSLSDLLGSKIEFAIAFRGNLLALVFGPSASHQAALLVSGSFGLGESPFRSVDAGEAGIAAVALDRLLLSVPRLWPEARDTIALDKLIGDTSVSLRTHGTTIAGELSLPVHAIALLEALHKRRPEGRDQKQKTKSEP